MKGLIILDGPDGAGKTTLGKRLVELYGGKYFHLTYRWKSRMFEYHTAALHHALSLANKQLVVVDRLWMSEIVYATVYRGGSTWPHMGRLLDRVIRAHAGLYVMCFDESMKAHQDRFMELKASRVEMYNDTTDVWALYNVMYHGSLGGEYGQDYFSDIANGPGLKARADVVKYSIDVEGRDIDSFCRALMTRLSHRQNGLGYLKNYLKYGSWLGYAPEAKYLFIGDRLSDAKFRSIYWPFYAYKNCSKFLLEQLSMIGFDETLACWVNANECFGLELVELGVKHYGLTPIFFGQQASLKFTGYNKIVGVKPRIIKHPQYYARFEHNTTSFIEDLVHAMDV